MLCTPLRELLHRQDGAPSCTDSPPAHKGGKEIESQPALPLRASTQQSRSLGLQCNLRSATSAHM